MSGDPKVTEVWRSAVIPDDPVKASNTRGAVSFASSGSNSRTTQVFVNLDDNSNLDGMGFAVFGHVVQGMDVVDRLNPKYGDPPPPTQGMIAARGNAYLREKYPDLDYIQSAQIVD
jgi:peptidyl-prolyl cis-trans isomerase A (cyclophilin A)